MGIGEILREAREEKSITLDELQETTKIQTRYLKAIEEGNFHILPGSFYARAFIKEYANAVGLNADELLTDHEDELPTLGEKRSEAQYTRLQRTRKSGPSKASSFFSFLPTVIVVLLVIGIIALAIYFYKQSGPGPASDNNAPQETDEIYRKKGGNTQPNDNNVEENTTENVEVQNEPEDEVVEEPEDELILIESESGQTPVSTFDFIHHGEDLVLTLESNGRAWVTVDNANGERLYHDFVTEDGSPVELDISDMDELSFIIGDASVVDIHINDITIEYPIDRNDFVYQKIKVTINQNE